MTWTMTVLVEATCIRCLHVAAKPTATAAQVIHRDVRMDEVAKNLASPRWCRNVGIRLTVVRSMTAAVCGRDALKVRIIAIPNGLDLMKAPAKGILHATIHGDALKLRAHEACAPGLSQLETFWPLSLPSSADIFTPLNVGEICLERYSEGPRSMRTKASRTTNRKL